MMKAKSFSLMGEQISSFHRLKDACSQTDSNINNKHELVWEDSQVCGDMYNLINNTHDVEKTTFMP